MLDGLLLRVIVLRRMFLWMIHFLVILGDFEQENLLQVSPNPAYGQVTYYNNRHYSSKYLIKVSFPVCSTEAMLQINFFSGLVKTGIGLSKNSY